MPSAIATGYSVGAPAPPSGDVFTIFDPNNGGANSSNSPRAVSYNGWTYIGFIHSSGAIRVTPIEESTLTVGSSITLHTYSPDVHDAPALLVRSSDHKLVVIYSGHNASEIYQRISTTSLDTDPDLSDGFAAEAGLHSQLGSWATYTYPSLVQLTDETNDPIYLFWRERHTTDRLRYSSSTDGGATWAPSVSLAGATTAGTSKTYWYIGSNGTDRFDVFFCDYSDGSDGEMRHFYYTGGNFKTSDGTTIISAADLEASAGADSLRKSDMTLVLDNSDGPIERCAGAAWDGTAPMGLAWQRHDSTNRVVSCRWRSGAWQCDTVVEDVGGFLGGVFMYDSRACCPFDDTDTVYVPKLDGAAWEMFRYTTANDGSTWTPEQLTTGSAFDNFFPTPPWNASTEIACVWEYGTLTSTTSWSLGNRGSAA